MSNVDWQSIDLKAKQWIKEAGDIIKESLFRTIKVESKSNADDLVTEMDRKVEQFFLHKISTTYPDHHFVGEEGVGSNVSSETGIIWIIDPIDGTTNFVHQQYNFAISVAVFQDGVGMIGLVYNVMEDELFHAISGQGAFLNERSLKKLTSVPVERSIVGINSGWLVDGDPNQRNKLNTLVQKVRATRSYGSAAIEMAYVAAGRLDGYISLCLAPWDFAAGLILVEEVGGISTTIEGKPIRLLEKNAIFTGKPGFHQEVLKLI